MNFMKNRSKKLLIAGIIIFLLLTGISLFVAIAPVYKYAMRYDESDIVDYKATAFDVIVTEERYEIKVSEYPCSLIMKKGEIIDEKGLLELHAGDEIAFKIPKFYDEMLNDEGVQSVPVVALNINDNEIVTFVSHLNMQEKSYAKFRITASVFSALFFCGAIICLIFLIKIKRDNTTIENNNL